MCCFTIIIYKQVRIVLIIQSLEIQQPTVTFHILGALGQITIYPGRTMKIIGTVTGPLKKYVGKSSNKASNDLKYWSSWNIVV